MAIILPILSTFNAAGVKAAQGALSNLGGSLKTLGKQALGATVGFQALQAAVDFAGNAVSEARDLERNMAALGTVFDNLTPRMKDFVKNAEDIGLSQVEAARTSTFLGSVLKQAGFGMEDVADNTEKLTVLAQDLATTFGYDTSEALTAMTALFRGEYDPIEKFGVALKQQEVNSLLAAKGLGKLTGQALLNAQQVVRMEQLFLRSADAAGAFARQSGTLFVEQKKLTAVFNNMEAALGAQLTPALADMMQALTPIVKDLTPKLVETFGYVGVTMKNLTPIVDSLGSIFGSVFDVVNKFAEILTPLGNNIASVLVVAFENLASVVERAVYWIDVIHQSLKDLNLTVDETKPAPVTEWLEGLGDRLGALNGLYVLAKQFKEQIIETNDALAFAQGASMGTQSRSFGRDRNALIKRGLYNKPPSSGTGNQDGKGKTAKDTVAEFYKDLKDELDKQAARLKLERLGASTAFIESIVGSGEDWKKVFANVAKRGEDGIAKLQKQFNKTSAGLKEIADANEALAKAAQDAYDEAFKAYEKQLEVYEKQIEAIQELKKSLSDLTKSVAPLAIVTREIGQFEQSTIDSFDNIVQAITEGVADGTLLKEAAQGLIDYARKEQAVIADLMRQRDDIANRRSLAQAMLADVKSAIVGMGNITEILGKTTSDVTETITKMVGGIQVATSKVIKGATGGATDLIASFTETLNKTKEFAKQLKDLRALGLDKNLYQQIVSAGIDAGGATAKAILEGGTGTVSELNSLFAELDAVGGDIAEQSAQVMYGAGIDLVDGLLNGLMSKEQELVNYATKLAETFATAFADKVNFALPMPSAPIAPALPSVAQTMAVNSALLDTFAVARDFAGSAENYYSGSESIRFANIAQRQGVPINITVNAGLGTDGKIVGQTIQSYINKYNKANSSF
jgi:phosphoglycolate phosphatase-like HAD superfamily hydrolase